MRMYNVFKAKVNEVFLCTKAIRRPVGLTELSATFAAFQRSINLHEYNARKITSQEADSMKRNGFRFIDAISSVIVESGENKLSRLDKSIVRRVNGRDRNANKNAKGTSK